MINPLFADDDDDKKPHKKGSEYVLPNRHGRKLQPISSDLRTEEAHPRTQRQTSTEEPKDTAVHVGGETPKHTSHTANHAKGANPAVELIRRKLETLYADEPEAKEEMAEVAKPTVTAPQRSKHQQFMYDLSTSGKSLAQIQTEWHNYYISLPDAEKHQVWQEFYANNGKSAFGAAAPAQQAVQPVAASPQPVEVTPSVPEAAQPSMNPIESMIVVDDHLDKPEETSTKPEHKPSEKATKAKALADKGAKALKKQVAKHVNMSAAQQAKAVQHFKSLMFGIASAVLVLAIVLFGLFNEMIIAPFIQPSSHASATPIILNSDGVAPSNTPEIIIPKISVEIPVDYSLTTNDESTVESALENGIVHYPSTVKPGEQGNAAFFGHSSNNIFNPGKYKFAFVLLHELVPGDIFYITYNSKVFTYRVYAKQVVKPSQVEVLNNVADKVATATLITCDPPGTSLNRLVVWGEQISPDPSGATAPTTTETQTEQPKQINGNGPTLWKRITNWITGD